MQWGRVTRAIGLIGCALLGIVGAVVADVSLWANDDSCPQWEDEGPMAAPSSAYSAIMCGPQDPPVVWALLIAAVAGLVVLVLGITRWRRRRGVLLGLAVVIVPSLVVGLLHLTLPKDCSSGRTETGACSRNREMR